MSARSNPFEELERLFERMSRQFEDTSRGWDTELPFARETEGLESMAVDIVEQPEEFVVTVDVPGFERDDVSLSVTEQTLRIQAERETESDVDEDDYLRHERREQSMRRSVRLPESIEKDSVTAKMKNGVLTVMLPKLDADEAHTIDIDSA